MLRVALSHILGGGRGFIQMDSRSLSATVGDGPERGHLSGLTGRPRSQSHSPQSKPLLLLLHHPLLPLSSSRPLSGSLPPFTGGGASCSKWSATTALHPTFSFRSLSKPTSSWHQLQRKATIGKASSMSEMLERPEVVNLENRMSGGKILADHSSWRNITRRRKQSRKELRME